MFQGLQRSFPHYWTGIYLRFLSIGLVYYFIVNPEDIETLNGLGETEILLVSLLVILIIAKK